MVLGCKVKNRSGGSPRLHFPHHCWHAGALSRALGSGRGSFYHASMLVIPLSRGSLCFQSPLPPRGAVWLLSGLLAGTDLYALGRSLGSRSTG